MAYDRGGQREDSPIPIWPPINRHHQLKAKEKEKAQKQRHLTPDQQLVIFFFTSQPVFKEHLFRLATRHRALVLLGKVNCPADVPGFARDL